MAWWFCACALSAVIFAAERGAVRGVMVVVMGGTRDLLDGLAARLEARELSGEITGDLGALVYTSS